MAGTTMKTVEISKMLKARANLSPSQTDEMGPPSCDVVYAMFLEPSPEPDPRWTTAECVIDKAVRLFQPTPALAHCELLVPPIPLDEGMRTQFGTYFGRQSGWQTDKADNTAYYLIDCANRWRAVPVFGANAASLIRRECDAELGVPYSLARYVSATPPFRYFANWLPDQRRSPAHCATLTARVLKNALSDSAPARASAWYGPTTLFHELSGTATWRGERMGASSYTGMPVETATAVEQLLRGVMSPETVSEVGDVKCLEAVRALTMRAVSALTSGDDVAQQLTQKQLATALLRWTILRE